MIGEGWRKKLGARLLTERSQERDWNRSEAAKAAGIDPGTVRRIELGQNYEVVKLELYARALGKPLEQWLRDVLSIESTAEREFRAWDGNTERRGGHERRGLANDARQSKETE